ncbi:hypothetical protein [Litchfieldia salsa]|uniref:Uncharacterized protein n=1 Tax=Litchfieldia salsa TaxID=930152 RepID=A0A1H0U0E5_9BACI|nr:hypothetical protein [Litchfieldia salsa]SDP59747.1 hypothetical protein SAMN05216565_10468 [Litchfieldia salsa]
MEITEPKQLVISHTIQHERTEGSDPLDSRIKAIMTSFVILLVCIYTYLKFNPPLQSLGYSWDPKDSTLIVVKLHNEGFAEANLQGVSINNHQQPQTVQLGISRTNVNVGIYATQAEKDQFSFHELDDYPILPAKKIEIESPDSIKKYGLVVDTEFPIEKLTIKYTYMGLPLKKVIRIEMEE